MQEQVNAINHNISSFHSIYRGLPCSWLEWFFSKSGNTSEAILSSEANSFSFGTLSIPVFSVSLYLTSSFSLSQLLNPSQWNPNLFPNTWLTFPSDHVFFPSLSVFLHPSFSEMCYFLLSFVWSLADRAFDLLMKKNATFTFHRLFKLTSAVCVWYSLLSSVSASALLRPGTASLCSAGPAGGVNSPMTDPLFTFLCTYRKSRRSQAGFEAFDILSRLVPGYEQVMHRTASPGIAVCSLGRHATHSCLSFRPVSENVFLSLRLKQSCRVISRGI